MRHVGTFECSFQTSDMFLKKSLTCSTAGFLHGGKMKTANCLDSRRPPVWVREEETPGWLLAAGITIKLLLSETQTNKQAKKRHCCFVSHGRCNTACKCCIYNSPCLMLFRLRPLKEIFFVSATCFFWSLSAQITTLLCQKSGHRELKTTEETKPKCWASPHGRADFFTHCVWRSVALKDKASKKSGWLRVYTLHSVRPSSAEESFKSES